MPSMQAQAWGAVVANPRFGRISVIEHLGADGKPTYNQPTWSQTRGEVGVVVDEDFRVALVESFRPVVLDPALYAENWAELGIPDPFSDEFLERQGMTIKELPRGYNPVLGDEAREEVRYEIKDVEVIGHHNTDTANMVTSPFVFVAKATSDPSGKEPDSNEKIKRVIWVPAEETRDLDTICGFTHGVLHKARGWALKQDDPFWRGLGERL